MIYISLLGTQPISIFNPLLALIKKYGRPDKVVFLGTEYILGIYKRVMTELKAHRQLSDVRIDRHTVSISLEEDKNSNPPVDVLLKELLGSLKEPVFFNIAGGMNFQLAACTLILDPDNCRFTYPEFYGVHLLDISPDGRVSDILLPQPDPLDVAAIQGVPLENAQGIHDESILMKDALAKVGIRELPPGCRENVRFAGVDFALVQNRLNTLCFYKILTRSGDFRKEINPIATDREQTADMYHRRIFIFTPSDEIADRARYNSLGKVETFDYANLAGTKEPDLKGLGVRISQAMGLKQIPKQSGIRPPSHPLDVEGDPQADGKTLVCYLGTDPMPTVKAIWSHQPDILWLLYTEDNERVVRLGSAFGDCRHLLPVKEVEFIPVDFLGRTTLEVPVPKSGEIEANITPGTKSHAFFLSLWARKNQIKLFSINNGRSQVESIPPSRSFAVRMPAPVTLLQLMGLELDRHYESQRDLLDRETELGTLLRFMTLIRDNQSARQGFPNQKIQLKDAEYFKEDKNSGLIIFRDQETPATVTLTNSYWLEQLVGYALLQCGADDIYLGVKEKLSANSEAFIRSRAGVHMPMHRNEYDVLARFGDNICMVECKSGKIKEQAAAGHATELKSTLPRFVVPLVCRYRYGGQPRKADNGIWIFGYRTLTDEDALKTLIERAFSERRTTTS
jgi:hypothetical protein